MADFDNFEAAGQAQEEDPAADFLAREQDQMAELDDANFGITQEPAQTQAQDELSHQSTNDMLSFDDEEFGMNNSDNTLLDATSQPSNQFGSDDPFTSEENPFVSSDKEAINAFPMTDAFLGGDSLNDEEPFNSGQQDFSSEPQMFDDFGSENIDPMSMPADEPVEPTGFAAISQVDKQRQEPEKIKKWREDQKERLTKKDADAEKKKEEWKVVAKKELQDWYKHRDEQLEKSFKLNREAEESFISERDDTIPGHEWERICRLCEFNPKATRNQKDISRMRSILLQLKQTPLVR